MWDVTRNRRRPPTTLRHRAANAALLLVALALAGCAGKMVYLFADGRLPASDPALKRQFDLDRGDCDVERAESVAGGDHRDGGLTRGVDVTEVGDDCMAERGYVLVPQAQLAAKQQQLAAMAADQARRDAAAAPKPN